MFPAACDLAWASAGLGVLPVFQPSPLPRVECKAFNWLQMLLLDGPLHDQDEQGLTYAAYGSLLYIAYVMSSVGSAYLPPDCVEALPFSCASAFWIDQNSSPSCGWLVPGRSFNALNTLLVFAFSVHFKLSGAALAGHGQFRNSLWFQLVPVQTTSPNLTPAKRKRLSGENILRSYSASSRGIPAKVGPHDLTKLCTQSMFPGAVLA